MALVQEKIKRSLLIWLGYSSVLMVFILLALGIISYKAYRQYRLLSNASQTQAHDTSLTKTHKKFAKIKNYQKKQQALQQVLTCLQDILAPNVRTLACEYHYKKPLAITLESHSLQGLMNTLTLLSCNYACTIVELSDTKPYRVLCEINALDHTTNH